MCFYISRWVTRSEMKPYVLMIQSLKTNDSPEAFEMWSLIIIKPPCNSSMGISADVHIRTPSFFRHTGAFCRWKFSALISNGDNIQHCWKSQFPPTTTLVKQLSLGLLRRGTAHHRTLQRSPSASTIGFISLKSLKIWGLEVGTWRTRWKFLLTPITCILISLSLSVSLTASSKTLKLLRDRMVIFPFILPLTSPVWRNSQLARAVWKLVSKKQRPS